MSIRKATGGHGPDVQEWRGSRVRFRRARGGCWTQTRNPNELLGWISATLGSGSSAGPGENVLGGLFGRG